MKRTHLNLGSQQLFGIDGSIGRQNKSSGTIRYRLPVPFFTQPLKRYQVISLNGPVIAKPQVSTRMAALTMPVA